MYICHCCLREYDDDSDYICHLCTSYGGRIITKCEFDKLRDVFEVQFQKCQIREYSPLEMGYPFTRDSHNRYLKLSTMVAWRWFSNGLWSVHNMKEKSE